MEVPEGMRQFYGEEVYLLLLKTIYGLKQAAFAFWMALLSMMAKRGFVKSKVDSCVYYKWIGMELVVWISWIDDLVCFGKKHLMDEAVSHMKLDFDCDDVGRFEEYVGCTLEMSEEKDCIIIRQPVLIQSFVDEFGVDEGKGPKTPAVPSSVLMKLEEEEEVHPEVREKYGTGVGKLLHLTRWSRPEIANSVRELTRHVSKVSAEHVAAMYRCIRYVVGTPKRGWKLKPTRKWNGKGTFEFIISGFSDSDYAKCPKTRRSVTGLVVFLEGAALSIRSIMQKVVALSVTEAELMAAVTCAQEMMFIKHLLESLGLLVKLPMVLKMDNRGAVDLINNFSCGGNTKHIEVRNHYLRELKEQGIIVVEWEEGSMNCSDLFTKNCDVNTFERHTSVFCDGE